MSLDTSGSTRTPDRTAARTPARTGRPLVDRAAPLIRRAAPVLGWVVTLAVAAQLAQGAYGQLTESERSVGMFEAIGYPASAVLLIGVLQGVAVLLYVVPWTAFLGALLLTAYLGGAVAAHVRLEDSLAHTLTPVLFAVGIWAALFLRSERIRRAVLTGR
ncbi:DoxX family protein [Promicromonospora kroppenstedtii]|uniref:DoxX family protein n=1 Tax=Promicromonospora kroppenstedtii TaxID=440482 RepID=UPI000A01DDE7|nr:DoxX family protein [Promicromonospora kroppenstedtii]